MINIKKIILLIPLFFIFCGCNDYKELNNIAIVSGLSIDKIDNKYEVNILVVNNKDENIIYHSNGLTISESIKNLNNIIPKQIYFGHLEVIIISEEIGRDGLNNITDYFFRNPETTKRFYIMMTKNNTLASEILRTLSPLESFPFQSISLNMNNSSSSGSLLDNLTYSKFIEMYLKKGAEPYIPTIEINNDDNNKYISTSGMAIFKFDKLMGYASNIESKGIDLVLGNAKEMLIKTKCDDNYITTTISDIKTNKKVKFINNKPTIYINIKATGDIEEVNCNIDLNDKKNIDLIKNSIENNIITIVNKGINISKKYESDVLEFGNLVYKKNPKYFNNIANWNNHFKNIKVIVKSDIKIRNKGSIKQSIKAAR